MTEQKREKRYYKVGEVVFIKPTKEFGKIISMDIDSEKNRYDVVVELIRKEAKGKNVIIQKHLKVWDIDKDLREYYKKINEAKRNELNVKVKYFTDAIEKIEKIEKGDWIDLRSAITVELKAGEFKLIPLGVAMQLPKGYEAHVAPRSSTFKNFGVIQTNSVGVVDNTYCGDNDQWFMPVYALRDTVINVNDRICQFRIEKKMTTVNFNIVETLGNEDRGGHGSTGIN